jgi:phosphoribosylformylglycinamidine synthase
MAIAGQHGEDFMIYPDPQRLDQCLLGESASRIIVTVNPHHQQDWEQYLQANLSQTWQKLGTVSLPTDPLTIRSADHSGLINLDVAALTEPWETAIARRLTVH